MRDDEIDAMLKAAGPERGYDPEKLKPVAEVIRASLEPVRPMPSAKLLTAGLFLTCAAVAFGGAARAGFVGFASMTLWDRGLIFPALLLIAVIIAGELVSAMIPGSRRHASAGTLLGATIAVVAGVFLLLFHDYQTINFVSAGVVCLLTGLLHAVIAAALMLALLRRGFAVNPSAAGLIAGMLAGVAGLGLLELHCPNFEAAHVLVWHTAVVPLSALAGVYAARFLQRNAR